MDAQLKKGLLEACVLADLARHDSYGYLILRDLAPIVELSESTLYQILRRLEKNTCLITYTKELDGRLRKYYSITPTGRTRLREFREEIADLARIYEFIIGRVDR